MKWKKKLRYNKKQSFTYLFLFLILLGISIGYALISTTLSVDGNIDVTKSTWNVHFENIVPNDTGISPTTAPEITDNTTVEFEATLENPGEFYEFNIDIVNDGTYNAKIDSINLSPTLTTEQQNYFNYSVKYSDGINIQVGDALDVGATETITIHFEYLENSDTTLYPGEDIDFDFQVTINYIQGTGTERAHPSFADDDWPTVIARLKSGNISPYSVGDEREVDLGTLGTHTIRIANTTTPAECSTTGFSGTACGVVLEFSDIITTHRINPYTSGVTTNGNGNIGGWPASEMRTYVNNDIYNALPEVLRNAIIDTTVVSGHGPTSGETNFTSTDKLYLLSTHEVYEEVDGNPSDGIDYYDTAYANTRQLDYYESLGVTTYNYSGAKKQINGSNYDWWLRSASYDATGDFFALDGGGDFSGCGCNSTIGVAPAFRIA